MNLSQSLRFTITQRNKTFPVDFSQQFRRGNDGIEREVFQWHLSAEDSSWETKGTALGTDFGNQCIYLQLIEDDWGKGIKIIRDNAPSSLDQILKNLTYIQSIRSDIFPEIYEFHKTIVNGSPCVVVLMEHIEKTNQPILDGSETWLPGPDKIFIENELSNPLKAIGHCVEEIAKYQLRPDLTWMKSANLIDGVIVDFHEFRHDSTRYILPNNAGKSKEELTVFFDTALERYKKWVNLPDSDQKPKWKGRLYQPTFFNAGEEVYGVPGYISDGKTFDSWVKMQFMPFGAPLIQNSEVLELGSCQGFFIQQAALAGCKHATGVELTPEDYQISTEINQITQLPNVSFVNGDAIEFVKNDTKHYGLVILSSVVHQLFPNFIGADEFMKSLIRRSKYVFLETVANHSKMSLPLEQVQEKLIAWAGGDENRVRCNYAYSAYGEGSRVIFTIYGLLQDI